MASQDRILEAARGEFAQHGYAARLQDIAERAGLTHPTLLYHFGSKEKLYAAVIEQAMLDWAAVTSRAVSAAPVGFDRVAALVAAAMEFFGTHHDFVVIWRREAIEGGARLEIAMAEHMRPFLDRAVAFLEREVAAGRLREHDPGRADADRLRRGLDVLLGRGLPGAAVGHRSADARVPRALPRRAHRDAAGRTSAALRRPEAKGVRSITAWR